MNLKDKIEQKLDEVGARYSFTPIPADLPLDVESHANFLKISLSQALATILYKTEKGIVAVQRGADRKINEVKLKELLGVETLKFADKSDLAKLGVESGLVPLTGLEIPIYMDKSIMAFDQVYGGSGAREFNLKIDPRDLQKVNGALVAELTQPIGKKRILTGDTPTGKLHVGHYVGTLENRVKLQDEYEEFIILADMHSFSTLSEQPEKVHQSTLEVALDNLAVGLDPKKVHIFIESQIPEIYELAAIYSMLVTHSRAMRNPTVKDEIVMKGLGDQFSLGFVNYPMYQAADITCVGAHLVPVGKDQAAHLEQTKEIVDRFNGLYGEILVRPEILIGRVGKLIGTDGNPKMGKSLNNTVMLSTPSEELRKIVMGMYTDPSRIHPTDPGQVEGNPVFIYHEQFNPNKEEVEDLKKRYREGKVGDVEVKEKLFVALDAFLEPIRRRRAYYEANMDEVMEILKEGTRVTREETQKTLEKVRTAMKIDYKV